MGDWKGKHTMGITDIPVLWMAMWIYVMFANEGALGKERGQ